MSAASECLGCLASYLPHTKLTRVQESVIPTIMQSDINIVVAAPTGSGKTALLEAAMLRLFKGRLSPKPSESEAAIPLLAAEDAAAIVSDAPSLPRGLDRRKAVYICPMKALAFEKFTQWQERFPLLKVTMETGDQESVWATSTTALNVSDADIIITTPERWDGITRRWKEGVVWELVASVALLMLDEVHTVSEERGAVLEAVVSRMKAIKLSIVSRRPNSNTTRFVAISGTLPNVEDFAEWLQVPPAGVFTFTSADRPLPLTLHVVSYASTSNNPFAFDRFLSFKLFGLVRRFSEGRPTLVFCASRSEAINSARRIIEDLRDLAVREGCEQRLRASDGAEHMASLANDKQLRSMLLLGIAYHHAAMTMSDRNLVERMFKEHYISVICTTTTLALGVNLPAHLVIVKGTTFFKNGNREDLPLSEVAQMSGRAGRPGLDTHGIALVLTTDDKAHLYQPLQHGDSSTCVESRLHQNMVEHVNAEVALPTIHNFSLGVEWIKTTFLWIRLQRCPRHYGILFRTKEEELKFDREKFAVELMHRMLGELESHGCITVRRDSLLPPGCDGHENDARSQLRESGDFNENVMGHARCTVECTHVGRAMARRYIQLKTVEVLNKEVLGQNPQYHDRGEGASQEGKVVTTNGESGTLYDGKEKKASKAFTLADVLRILSSCSEFGDIRLRQGDRKHLNEL
uniref:DNA 3'-5' helicase n=1 Tax=Trypanosoma congolense (strain IL3000) TaxID=1068625 RepID=G0V2V0_TRYCI|nr:unnamed protein product [Trypanosoma congolense IL3000]